MTNRFKHLGDNVRFMWHSANVCRIVIFMETKQHIFEQAGLGQSPYKYVGLDVLKFQAAPGEPTRPGGSCDYCGTCITNAARFVSADGKAFKVGLDCAQRAGLKKSAKRASAELARLKDEGITAQLIAIIPSIKDARTADYCNFILAMGGAAGRARALKRARAAA